MAVKGRKAKKSAPARRAAARKKPASRSKAMSMAAKRKQAKKKKKVPAKSAAARKIVRQKPAARVPARRVPADTAAERAGAYRDLTSPARAFTPYVQKRGELYMNTAQAKHFRNILLDWKRSLMEEVDRTVHHMQDEASNFPDPNDRATQEEEFALELRTRDRERKLIKKIDEALLGLDTGDYGYCEICGVEIGIKRLEARPTATLCIDCKTLDEIKEKQLG